MFPQCVSDLVLHIISVHLTNPAAGIVLGTPPHFFLQWECLSLSFSHSLLFCHSTFISLFILHRYEWCFYV